MRLRKTWITVLASAGIGAAALLAPPAYAVNTSFIFFNDPSFTAQPVACAFDTTGSVQHPTEIIRVVNNCEARMWLHQYRDGTGRALCINPDSTAVINNTYRQWQVTSNPASC
jgi:hypothetical protein